ncbi:MAG: excinuclease ABC subunit UvrA [Phycisphaerae bacterium]|nr:excinuclease ABC subunit UvrA [Phycisphaerae bacterium]
MEPTTIEIRGAREHNLRNVSLSLPRNALICLTGVSGSGKSSLAFDTLYAEGQRRYVESLSSYARQFLGQLQKPDCDQITGLSPAIAIQQKTSGWNPRSTVGTVTGLYDFLRVLYARVGVQHCTRCHRPISAQSREQIIAAILQQFPAVAGGDRGRRLIVLAPVARAQKGEFRELFEDMVRGGHVRARVDGRIVELRSDLALEKNKRHDIEIVIDRLVLHEGERHRIAEAVDNALRLGEGTLIVAEADSATEHKPREMIFSSRFACARCGLSFEPPSPQLFSFNSPTGMCLTCDGLGERIDFDPDLLVPDPSLNFYAPCVAPLRHPPGRWRRHIYDGVARHLGVDLRKAWKDLPESARRALLYGTGDAHITFEWFGSGGRWKHGGTFEGVIAELHDKYRKAKAAFVREYYEKYMRRGPCPACHGARLNPQAREVRIPISPTATDRAIRSRRFGAGGPNIHELGSLPVDALATAIARLRLSAVQQLIVADALKEIRTRLDFLLDVGLDYLTLNRTAPTLSGGESQRIRLAGQIGSGLTGVLYVLDEPSVGLHARDNLRLLESLRRLRDMGNTVVVVEHDEETMRAADRLIDFGPGPGVRGGQIVAEGSAADVSRNPASLTGDYLAGRKRIEVPKIRRPVGPPPLTAPGTKSSSRRGIRRPGGSRK